MWVRSDWVEDPDVFDLLIAWKNDMHQMGHKVLELLLFVHTPPQTLTEWATMVTDAVNSAPDVEAWEVWNEPNLNMFKVGYQDGTPQHYVNMLQSAYSIIKTRNPNALVVGPGLYTGDGVDWLQSIIDLGALDYLDVVSIHFYGNNVSQNQAILNQVKSMVGAKPV